MTKILIAFVVLQLLPGIITFFSFEGKLFNSGIKGVKFIKNTGWVIIIVTLMCCGLSTWIFVDQDRNNKRALIDQIERDSLNTNRTIKAIRDSIKDEPTLKFYNLVMLKKDYDTNKRIETFTMSYELRSLGAASHDVKVSIKLAVNDSVTGNTKQIIFSEHEVTSGEIITPTLALIPDFGFSAPPNYATKEIYVILYGTYKIDQVNNIIIEKSEFGI